MEINEIDDVTMAKSIDEISCDPTTQQTEADLGHRTSQPEGTPPDKNREQRRYRKCSQHHPLTGEHAPRRSGIADVNNVEESVYYSNRPRLAVSWIGQPGNNPALRKLIEDENRNGNREEQTVRTYALDSRFRSLDFRFVTSRVPRR